MGDKAERNAQRREASDAINKRLGTTIDFARLKADDINTLHALILDNPAEIIRRLAAAEAKDAADRLVGEAKATVELAAEQAGGSLAKSALDALTGRPIIGKAVKGAIKELLD